MQLSLCHFTGTLRSCLQECDQFSARENENKGIAGRGWKHLADMISALHVSGFLLDTPGLVSAAAPSRGDQH